jgi:hypothetical protein
MERNARPLSEQATHWPTPRTEDSENCGNHPRRIDSLTGATRRWATPQAHDAATPKTLEQIAKSKGGSRNLNEDATHWSPTTSRSSRLVPTMETHGHSSSNDGHGSPPPSKKVLNPRFVTWLMGWPAHPVQWTCTCRRIPAEQMHAWEAAVRAIVRARINSD